MYTSHYDVLIAGAGPGGLTTALALKRQGIHYLLIDRASRDRLCADMYVVHWGVQRHPIPTRGVPAIILFLYLVV
ncbi:MAG: FAD-dependent monooxygenase [Acidobacteriota bacterium]